MNPINGFSLIELMIVIAIISILSMLAIPSYQQYTQRARFTEIILATTPFKTAIALALQQGIPINELMINTHDIPSAPAATKNLATLTVEKGVITATSTSSAGEATLILTPNMDGSQWTVSGSCLKVGLCAS
ncbi:MAG: hypothetical protein A3E83_02230 [Gammaproteobacteria bacterium RIFCSPHIGHO2_12_FULL_41_20]|nr:MAG: hypothetical protein A3E83_02230 [Gammaproteobacteria bacterium RIFCSPHIGHO2_12_FULL_41_20]